MPLIARRWKYATGSYRNEQRSFERWRIALPAGPEQLSWRLAIAEVPVCLGDNANRARQIARMQVSGAFEPGRQP